MTPPPPPASNKRPVDTRAAHLAERGLPTNTPSGPSRRGLASSRWGPYTARAPPNAPWAARKAPPAAQHAPGEDDLPMPPAPAYIGVPLPPSSPPKTPENEKRRSKLGYSLH
ncbi:hypothetical protein EN45_097250 [Penicillium chrysogenum]|uniref:Uncharacterized protein n=1 Tax=Penicillium chrysogenum TaxID=5076 RepID=A0A167R475_PENCH|nr:hypothetical protein NUH16_000729 [Penicillium rubens]KZN85538.1 hypothetical protein EN45_097250 [Penicillium chrysogenum]